MIEFLDVNVILENGMIKTDPYTKITDKHQYLHTNSCPPNSVKRAIPCGLEVRVKRICSSEEHYKTKQYEMK